MTTENPVNGLIRESMMLLSEDAATATMIAKAEKLDASKVQTHSVSDGIVLSNTVRFGIMVGSNFPGKKVTEIDKLVPTVKVFGGSVVKSANVQEISLQNGGTLYVASIRVMDGMDLKDRTVLAKAQQSFINAIDKAYKFK